MGKRSKNLTPEQLETMGALYPDHDNAEVAQMMGVSIWTVKTYQTKYGWHKSKEYLYKVNRQKGLKLNAAHLNTKESIAKRSRSWKKLYAQEKGRVFFGLPQKTLLHVRTEPRPKIMQRNRLERMGYVIDNTNMIAYWTPETQRATTLEKIPRRHKLGNITAYFEFRPISEKPQDNTNISEYAQDKEIHS